MADITNKKPVAESQIADVFENRHPSDSERQWAETTLARLLEKQPERPIGAATGTNIDENGHARIHHHLWRPIRRLYTKADLPEDWDANEKYLEPSRPGSLHARHSRHRLSRQALDDAPVRRLRLSGRNQPALQISARSTAAADCRVAFDLPTLMGYDSDHLQAKAKSASAASPSIRSKTWRSSSTASTREDHRLDDHQLARVGSVGHVSGRRGKAGRRLEEDSAARSRTTFSRNTSRRRNTSIRPRPRCGWSSTRSSSARNLRRVSTPISITGYHIREAGSTALQELAFTIYDGIEYVEWALRRGLDVDDFAPRLSFFFNAHNDFFEEIAKYRAARKIWYRVMKDRFDARTSARG